MILESFASLIIDMISNFASNLIGVNLKEIKKSLNKAKSPDSSNLELSKSIDSVCEKLEDSKAVIDNALAEMDKQKKLYEQMKKDAEISQQISSMNKEQVTALNTLLEKTLTNQEKKTATKNFLTNLFFCILSAVIGFLLGKYL